MSEFDQTLPMYSDNKYEEEIFQYKKQMRTQEAEWKKNKAVLEQRIEILELQNRELKEREENQKNMNDSIFSALKNFNKEVDPTYGKIIKDLEESKQQISREYADLKVRFQETVKNAEKESKELKDRIAELETKYNLSILHYEKTNAALQQKVQNLENEKKNVSMVLNLYEDERKQFKEKELNQNELESKLSEVRYLLEKQENDRHKEIERLNRDYNQNINNIKQFAESEKRSLEAQISKLIDSKKIDGSVFEDIKKNYEGEIVILRREREHSFRKNETLEHQIGQLHESVRAGEEQLVHQRSEFDKESKEFKKLRSKMMDLDSQIKKFEQIEKNLKQMVTEKEYKMEEMATDHKKKLTNEKRRYDQAQELAKKYKEEGEKKCSVLVEEGLKKDEYIKKLKAQLRNRDYKLSQKLEIDPNKTNTSLVNISLVNQSTTSKYNPSRSFIKEVKTSREVSTGSRSLLHPKKSQAKLSSDKENFRGKIDTEEEDEDPKDLSHLTNENILLGLNSPRIFNSLSSYRPNSSSHRKEPERAALSANRFNEKQNSNYKKEEKSCLAINVCEACNQEIDERNTEEDNGGYTHRGNRLNTTGLKNYSNSSFETRKKSTIIYDGGHSSENPKVSYRYSNNENGKVTPFETDNNRSYLHLHELDTNIPVSDKNGNKHGLSLTPSVSHISKNYHEGLESTNRNNLPISSFQYNSPDYNESADRAKIGFSNEKIRYLEERLREFESRNERLALDKDKLQVEHERVVLELKQTKMEWALSEESKEECELALKNEIKFLINKLLQVKNIRVNSSTSQGDLSQYTKSTLNKSTLDPQLSFITSSAFSNLSQYNPVSSNQYEQNNMTIINNNLGERRVNSSTDKKGLKSTLKVYTEESDDHGPLPNKLLNSGDFDGFEGSPRKVSEFNNNENSLLMNLLNTSTNPKKLMHHVKR